MEPCSAGGSLGLPFVLLRRGREVFGGLYVSDENDLLRRFIQSHPIITDVPDQLIEMLKIDWFLKEAIRAINVGAEHFLLQCG